MAKFEGERAEFLRALFRCATKAAIWFSIDLEQTAQRLASTRERIVKALNYLEEKGDVVLKVAGLRHGYRVKDRPADLTALKQTLSERFETRENNDILRVEQVVELAEDPGCIVRRLLAHFGEDLGRDCGHCSVCLGVPARPISAESPPEPVFDAAAIRTLRRAHREALATPRRVARFLCGLSSPLLTSSKLSKHPFFGALAEAPFREVMAAVSSE